VRGFRLAIGSHRSTAALLRAAFAPLPLPNSQTEAQIIRAFRHLALMGGFVSFTRLSNLCSSQGLCGGSAVASSAR
jgi:hypothetical protein